MLYSKFLALGALLPFAFAQTNTFTIESEDLSAGTPFDITWTPGSDGPVNLILRQDQGDVNNLAIISIIAEEIPNTGSYTYTPPSTLVSGSGYAFEIQSSTNPQDVNYSPQFSIESPTATSVGSDTTVTSPPIFVDPTAVTSVTDLETFPSISSATSVTDLETFPSISSVTGSMTTMIGTPTPVVDPIPTSSPTVIVDPIRSPTVSIFTTLGSSVEVIIDPIRTSGGISTHTGSVSVPPVPLPSVTSPPIFPNGSSIPPVPLPSPISVSIPGNGTTAGPPVVTANEGMRMGVGVWGLAVVVAALML